VRTRIPHSKRAFLSSSWSNSEITKLRSLVAAPERAFGPPLAVARGRHDMKNVDMPLQPSSRGNRTHDPGVPGQGDEPTSKTLSQSLYATNVRGYSTTIERWNGVLHAKLIVAHMVVFCGTRGLTTTCHWIPSCPEPAETIPHLHI
jgi:hypothetical protein